MRPPRIISLGEVLWDLFPDGERFGGAPANFASHAALLGADVAIVSAVGDDMGGKTALEILRGYGIDVSLIRILSDAATGTVGVELDAHCKPTFTIHENSAWDCLPWSDEIQMQVADADAVYFGTLGQRSEPARSTIRKAIGLAKSKGLPRILDINLRVPFFNDLLIRESVELASILKMSDEELSTVCAALKLIEREEVNATVKALRDQYGLEQIVLTRGADGALSVTADETIDQPGIPTEVRDSVGAGDAFTASFVTSLLQGEQPAENLRRACELAAEVCSKPGAVPKAAVLM
jgi:fructokinase